MNNLTKKYGTHGIRRFADLFNELGSEEHDFTQAQLEIVGNVLTDVAEAMEKETTA